MHTHSAKSTPPALRSSSYILAVPIKDLKAVFLVHGYTGALDLVSHGVLAFLHAHASDKPLNPMAELDANLITRLYQRGYLVGMTADEEYRHVTSIAAEIHEHKKQVSANTFWVIPTYRCNLRCSYCFQEHALHSAKGTGATVMDQKTIDDLFDALSHLGGPFPSPFKKTPRYLTLFGGEPLMSSTYPAVVQIVNRAIDAGYKVGAVTNGVELDEFLHLIGRRGIRWLQITLDGTRLQHDQRRRLPMVGDNFDRIIRNISSALNAGATVSVRTNVDAAILNTLEDIDRLAQQMGWSESEHFHWYAVPVETHAVNGRTQHQTVVPLDIYDATRSKCLCTVRAPYRDQAISQLTSVLRYSIDSVIQTSACGAHTGMWFFDPFGMLYSCAEQAGQPEHAVGSYLGGSPVFREDKLTAWHSRHVGSIPECSRCPYALFCGGGCANAARLSSGTMFAPRCFGIKEVFNESAGEFVTNWIDNNPAEQGSALGRSDGPDWLRSLNATDLVKSNLTASQYVDRYVARLTT